MNKNFISQGTTRKRLNLSINDTDFFIDFHFNDGGTTTIDLSSGKKTELKIEIAKFIKETCLISDNANNKWFVANNIDQEDFHSIIEIVEESELYKETLIKESTDNFFLFQCKGRDSDKVTVKYYNNKKVVIQGKPLLLFNDIVTMFCELIDTDDIPKVFNDCYDLQIDKDAITTQFEILLPNSYDKHEPKLRKILLQAVYNSNIKGEMFDYSYLVFPALRGLEGHIRYVYHKNSIQLNGGPIGSIYEYDNKVKKHYLNSDNRLLINNDSKVAYIEKAYNYYRRHRHSISHYQDIENPQDDTRIIENYGEAIRLIHDTLSIIDEYYKEYTT